MFVLSCCRCCYYHPSKNLKEIAIFRCGKYTSKTLLWGIYELYFCARRKGLGGFERTGKEIFVVQRGIHFIFFLNIFAHEKRMANRYNHIGKLLLRWGYFCLCSMRVRFAGNAYKKYAFFLKKMGIWKRGRAGVEPKK